MKFALFLLCLGFLSCVSSDDAMPGYREGFPSVKTPAPEGAGPTQNPYSLGRIGSGTDAEVETRSGLVIMGGGTDVDAAFKWMIDRSEGGDVVVIRASGTDAYNPYIYDLGTVNSVETLLIDSRAAANDERVVQTLKNAEALFIAGGDQSQYMEFWRGTQTEEALNYLLNEKKVPVGGTSAGAAILGGLYYSGENGSITSEAALSDPYNNRITLYAHDFLQAPFMADVVADQHFSQRERLGRLVAFLARYLNQNNEEARGIGVDERTAVCIDDQGVAQVFGANAAYFIETKKAKQPEVLAPGQNLEWNQNERALSVYRITGSEAGSGTFNVQSFQFSEADGGVPLWWWVENGKLKSKNQ